jgi:hypothetical protein
MVNMIQSPILLKLSMKQLIRKYMNHQMLVSTKRLKLKLKILLWPIYLVSYILLTTMIVNLMLCVCIEIDATISQMWKHKFSYHFRNPVNPKQLSEYIPKLADQGLEPMDLSTMQTKATRRAYDTPERFMKDMEAIYLNSKCYNGAKSPYTIDALCTFQIGFRYLVSVRPHFIFRRLIGVGTQLYHCQITIACAITSFICTI